MANNHATPGPEGNGPNGNKENGDSSLPYDPLEDFTTLAAIAVAAAAPATPHTAAPPTIETDQPTVEMVEDINATTGGNTGESVQPAPPHASASGHGPATSAAPAFIHPDTILSRMTHRLSPYLAETPNQFLGQVWINHIDSLLGVRTRAQAEDMRNCVEQTDRVVHLANDILRQQRELLAEVRRIVTSGGYHSGDESHDDEDEGDDGGDGTAANGNSAAN